MTICSLNCIIGIIRKSTESNLVRLAEISVFAKRIAYRLIFKDDEFSFNVLTVTGVMDVLRMHLDAILVWEDSNIVTLRRVTRTRGFFGRIAKRSFYDRRFTFLSSCICCGMSSQRFFYRSSTLLETLFPNTIDTSLLNSARVITAASRGTISFSTHFL